MLRDDFRWIDDGKVAGFRGPDPEVGDLEWLRKRGIKAIIRMAELDKALVSHSQVEQAGLHDLHEPVPDFTAPSQRQIHVMIDFITDSLKSNLPVVVTCGAEKGRTGTVLACYLVCKGETSENAIIRAGTVEKDSQKDAVREFEKSMKRKRTRINR